MSGSISNEGHESWRSDISGYGVQFYIFACGWRQRLSCWRFILQLLPALVVEGDLMLVFSLDDLSLKAFDRCRSFDFFYLFLFRGGGCHILQPTLTSKYDYQVSNREG